MELTIAMISQESYNVDIACIDHNIQCNYRIRS
jgi:hypothetical protein